MVRVNVVLMRINNSWSRFPLFVAVFGEGGKFECSRKKSKLSKCEEFYQEYMLGLVRIAVRSQVLKLTIFLGEKVGREREGGDEGRHRIK